jgi:hypothetical protein
MLTPSAVRRVVLIGSLNAVLLTGCGTYVPQVREFYDGPDTPDPKHPEQSIQFQIRERIFCELVEALKHVRANYTSYGVPIIPDNYGVQVQINLTVEETGALNPSATFNDTMRNASVLGVTVPQSFNLGASGTFSSTASRIDTSYSYYIVDKIAAEGANGFCDTLKAIKGSSPFLESDLGIEKYLVANVPAAVIFRSSEVPEQPKKGRRAAAPPPAAPPVAAPQPATPPVASPTVPPAVPPATPPAAASKGGAGKGTGSGGGDQAGAGSKKIDIYSYEIKFVIVSSGSANPSWKLVNISTGTGALPLASAGRTRTHDLILTFGPSGGQGLAAAFQTHFTNQIVHSRGG